MAMNELSTTQIYTLVNAVAEQATGRKQLMPTNTSDFIAVANTALLAGYDDVINAISQVLSRTIFSIRPYNRKLADMQVSNIKFGNHVRKLQALDGEFEKDERKPLTDGTSIDMYEINKPKALQTNFYGQTVYQKHVTLFRDQLDVAFSSPEEFGRFITMIMQNISDQIEQAHEGLARMTLANLIAGVITIGNQAQIVHILTEYNTATGNSYTPTTIMAPEVYKAFNQWAFARVAAVSSMLTERTVLYHQNITGKEVSRHTPGHLQRVYLYAPFQYQINSMVLANTFHNSYLTTAKNEQLNYWQAPDKGSSIDVTCTYLQTNGDLAQAEVQQDNIYGVILDEEAAGYTVINQWNAATPFNAAGGYTNMFWHFTDRYWNDFTENAVVFLMD